MWKGNAIDKIIIEILSLLKCVYYKHIGWAQISTLRLCLNLNFISRYIALLTLEIVSSTFSGSYMRWLLCKGSFTLAIKCYICRHCHSFFLHLVWGICHRLCKIITNIRKWWPTFRLRFYQLNSWLLLVVGLYQQVYSEIRDDLL